MSYVKDTEIFEATNGGLDILLSYYPALQDIIDKSKKLVKLRESEKTASASLKQLENGIWVVTDFGGENKPRNGIQVCVYEENIEFGEACALLGSRYKIQGAALEVFKPIIEKRALENDEIPGEYRFIYKDFTDKELIILGKRVNAGHCLDFNLKSVDHFIIFKENEAIITRSTDDYPLFAFDNETWVKLYQPNSFEKQWRFRYFGEKPKTFIFGLDLLKSKFDKNKKIQQEEIYDNSVNEDSDEESEKKEEKKEEKNFDPRIEKVFIMSGGSDGINLWSFKHFPLWKNSESEHFTWDEIKKIKVYAKEIYYVGDLDSTGVKQAIAMGLKFLDMKLVWLPERLKRFGDKRGNPCKDYKDYVDKFYQKETAKTFINGFEKLITNALPLQFWTEYYANKKLNYNLSNTRLYHFLAHMGFGRYENKNSKEGFIYVKKEGSIVKILHPLEIENYVHDFLEQRQMSPELRDYMYNSPKLQDRSLSKLPKIEIDFTDADRHTQYIFFAKKVWKVTAAEILEYKQGEVEKYVWEDKIIDFNIKKEDPQFKVFTDQEGNLDIDIIKKDNPFFNYLINTSRVHWRKELEDHFEGRPDKEEENYFKKNQFNIAGENLSADEIYEQKLHLINKMYTIGYILHKYKDESRSWAVFAMDNKVSDNGESHGGSGKSLCYSYLDNFLRRFYIEGRNQKNVESEFVYHGVTEDTDYILVDDASQYLKFDNYFSAITGSLKVNPKNGVPFEIPFSKAPKFVFSSNFTVKDPDPSTVRRILFSVFSDYYHYNKDNEYKQVRQVSDDFGGRNLFKDFTEAEWNAYYNFCIQCIQFYLGHGTKANPPMDNVTKRSLMSEMGDAFMGWADAFFATKWTNPANFDLEENKYLDNYFSKEMAFDDFMKASKQGKWSTTKFKKALKAYCQFNGYVLNPKDLQNDKGRILQKIEGKTTEAIYIRTILPPPAFTSGDVKEYTSEDEIFNNK